MRLRGALWKGLNSRLSRSPDSRVGRQWGYRCAEEASDEWRSTNDGLWEGHL